MLENQNIGVHRHAHGEDDSGDTRQSKCGLQQRQSTKDYGQIDYQGHIGHDAKQPVSQDHKNDHGDKADDTGDFAGGDGIGAEAGTDAAFLKNSQRRGQCAGAQ